MWLLVHAKTFYFISSIDTTVPQTGKVRLSWVMNGWGCEKVCAK